MHLFFCKVGCCVLLVLSVILLTYCICIYGQALTIRGRINAVHSDLKLVVESKDVDRVEAMIVECKNLGLPEKDFLLACKLKQTMDDMLAQLSSCALAQIDTSSRLWGGMKAHKLCPI